MASASNVMDELLVTACYSSRSTRIDLSALHKRYRLSLGYTFGRGSLLADWGLLGGSRLTSQTWLDAGLLGRSDCLSFFV